MPYCSQVFLSMTVRVGGGGRIRAHVGHSNSCRGGGLDMWVHNIILVFQMVSGSLIKLLKLLTF